MDNDKFNCLNLGFIGLGAMGGPMAKNLLRAGYRLIVFDIDPERIAALVTVGAEAAQNVREVVQRTDIVLTSLRSSEVWVEVAEGELVDQSRTGQIFIDLGTVVPLETRRLAALFAERGAALVDAPVSGGPSGASTGKLRIFVGGDRQIVQRVWPILEVLGDPERIVYCGAIGAGQVVKGCNQLAMGLADAAYMEALAFGVREGIDPSIIGQAVGGGPEPWRRHFESIADRVAQGQGEALYVKFPELPYFLAEADAQGTPMPLTRA
ncbi:MAG: NAD(P)-dependent oxidoreductase [Candidatus Zipacnadales bacterium]